MLKMLQYLRRQEWLMICCSLIFIVGQIWLELRIPDYMSEITTLVQTPGSTIAEIIGEGVPMLLCALGSLISAFVVGFFAAKIAAGLAQRLRSQVFNQVLSFSMEEIAGFSTASLITRSTNDITQVQMFIAIGMQALLRAPIMAVWAVCKIAGKGWEWTAATGCAVAVLMVMLTVIIIFAMPKFRIMQRLTDNLNRITRENLTGIRVVRAYNAEAYQEEKFARANDELTNTNLFTSRIMAIMHPGMTVIMSGLTLAIYWIGAILINNTAAVADKLTLFSNMVVFSSYAVQVIMSFMMLTIIFIILPRASVSARRILEVLETPAKIIDGEKNESELYERGEIEFRHVSFKYPDAAEYVLHDINFTAHHGETVAFIGSTGSGKSTLVNLVPRFYDATEGEVLIDGINVKEYTQWALHNKIGYVPQKAVMFSGTIASNVAYGDNGRAETSDEDIIKAVEIAQAAEFVNKKAEQYEAPVAQGGSNLSGGQKQRLSIARAICRQPEIYIFDDSFSALDYKTDRILRSTLKKETAGVTTLIVAQRIGTIKDADQIIVIDKGCVVGQGTHQHLLQSCDVYREIAESQLSKEELEHA